MTSPSARDRAIELGPICLNVQNVRGENLPSRFNDQRKDTTSVDRFNTCGDDGVETQAAATRGRADVGASEEPCPTSRGIGASPGVSHHGISARSCAGMADLDRILTRPIQWLVSKRSPTVLNCPATICACHSGSRVTARIVRHWSQRNWRTGTVVPEPSLRARRDTIMMLGTAAHLGHLPFKVVSGLCIKHLFCAGDETDVKMAAPRGDGQK
jgi:hypothetical protein